jgi:carbonic anhydrase
MQMDLNRRCALKVLAGLAACPVCGFGLFAAEGAHWSYEGAQGPSHWGELDAGSLVCSTGSQQSPIDIQTTVRAELPALKIQ